MTYEMDGWVFKHMGFGKHGSVWRMTWNGMFFANVSTKVVTTAIKLGAKKC
jgi:hypothetical protein